MVFPSYQNFYLPLRDNIDTRYDMIAVFFLLFSKTFHTSIKQLRNYDKNSPVITLLFYFLQEVH